MRIGPYEIVGQLGRGAHGTVFRARDAAARRDVAIKLLGGGRTSPRGRARFLREAEITASLRHPAILRVHASGEVQGAPWIAYELVEGTDLAARIGAGDLPRQEGLRLLRDAARGVGAAHAAGIVHRDLKPANLLIAADGSVRVADFGLAVAVDLERLTLSGELVGSPAYMAPEQLSGQRSELGPATDVWALGVALFEVLTGELPFETGSLLQLAAAVSQRDAPDPREVVPSLSPSYSAVCTRALARDPRDRYPNGDALADDLDRLLRGESIEARAALRLPRPGLWIVGAAALLLLVLSATLPPLTHRPALQAPAQAPPAAVPSAAPIASVQPAPKPIDGDPPAEAAPRPPRTLAEHVAKSVNYRDLDLLREQASAGNSAALLEMARLHFAGEQGVAVDVVKSTEYARQASERGNTEAMALYANLLLLQKQYAEGLRWLERGHAAGEPRATLGLAKLYDGTTPSDLEVNEEKAIALYRALISTPRSREALYSLGNLLLERGRPGDRAEGLDLLARAVLQGDTMAAFRYAKHIPEDDDEAHQRAVRALRSILEYGKEGYQHASYPLGKLLVRREETVAEGVALLERSFDLSAEARIDWAQAVFPGYGDVPPNPQGATEAMLLAGRAGHRRAWLGLARMLQIRWASRWAESQGMRAYVPELHQPNLLDRHQVEITRELLRLRSGDQRVVLALANAYREGWGVPRDPTRAFQLYEACPQVARARFWRSILLDNEEFEFANPVAARHWLELAAKQKHPGAMVRLALKLEEEQGPDEEIQRLLVAAAAKGHPSAAFLAGRRAQRSGQSEQARELLTQALRGGIAAAAEPLATLGD